MEKKRKPIQQQFEIISERAGKIMQCFLQSDDGEVKEWTPAHVVHQSFLYAALFEQQKLLHEEKYWDEGTIIGIEINA